MFLLNSGSSPQDLVQAGLSLKTERGLMLDRFRGRIMFPIHNHLGKVVGFTGRILPQLDRGDMGKYVNSPETPIFQKSKLLYGFWKSKDVIREAKSAVLVEGQMDFLMSYQSGVKNIVASSGTALTADHLRVIHRLSEELILCFDSDVAGADAAERAIDLAEASDFNVKIATFKDFKDAADAAKADPNNVAKTLAAAVPAPRFYFDKYLPADMAALKTREGLQRLRAILAKLKHIASPVDRSFWFAELAKVTGIAEKTLDEEAEKANPVGIPAYAPKAEEAAKRHIARVDLICEKLFSAAVARNNFDFLDDVAAFFTPVQKEMFRLLKSGKKKSEDPSLDEAIDLIVLGASQELKEAEIDALKAEFTKEYYKDRRSVLTQAIKNAEAKGNEAELKGALEELRNLPAAAE